MEHGTRDDAAAKPDPTGRFSDRVANYIAYRPGYPAALVDALRREVALAAAAESQLRRRTETARAKMKRPLDPRSRGRHF
jgi:threonine synthase